MQVDLAGQHVYMIKDGACVWDAPCVTGNVSKAYTTPDGIYSLTYKEKDRILRGKKLDNGSMNMKAMWITGCHLMAVSDFMMLPGEISLEERFIRQVEAMAA